MNTQNYHKLGIISLAFFILILFSSCEDKSYFKQIYKKDLYKEPILCLQLQIEPFNQDIYDYTNNLFDFKSDCNRVLKVRYKTNIGCNSPYSTNKSYQSFIELNLIKNKKTYYTIYKDLKDEAIKDEINLAFITLKKEFMFK